MLPHRFAIALFCALILLSASAEEAQIAPPGLARLAAPGQAIGGIERLHPDLDALITPGTVIEMLAEGMQWSEGPLWIEQEGWLLFSDVKENRAYRWSEELGLAVYLEPSGFTGTETNSRERGSNGLAVGPGGELFLAQHGDRRIAKLATSLRDATPVFQTIAATFEGSRFNSPNDLVFDRQGNLYFTDPPFGLSEAMMDDPAKELAFQGVFRVAPDGELTLLTDQVSRPNGLAFSPDESTLYVANTDAQNAVWYAFPHKADGSLGEPSVVYDATPLIGKEVGYPDGIKVDARGNIFTAGPGGLWIFSPAYELLGRIRPGEWVSNCALDEAGGFLYITADDKLLRVKLNNP